MFNNRQQRLEGLKPSKRYAERMFRKPSSFPKPILSKNEIIVAFKKGLHNMS
jgi:hypothetical protein